MKRTRIALTASVLALGLAGFVLLPPDDAQGGMSSSALVGVLQTATPASLLVVNFKVIDNTNGRIVWQSSPSDVNIVSVGPLKTYSVVVDASFRPDDPRYEWVMWVSAVRAWSPVYWTSFLFNDVFDVDHFAVTPSGNIKGRIAEAHVTIND